MRRVLRPEGGRILKLVQRGRDISWHREVYGSSGVVPVQSKFTVELAVPVGCDGVEGLKGCDEMFRMTAPDVFDPKIVYDKGESNGTGLVAPEAGRLVFFGNSQRWRDAW
jgi:hypothetical protein